MFDKKIIQSIRILPSDKSTFPTEQEFKSFVEKTMVERGGYYYFPNLMMNCPPNTLVLFQYEGMIRATGVLIDLKKEEQTDERGVKYAGYYQFDVTTLHYLLNPANKEHVQKHIPSFTGFNQSKQKVDLGLLDSVLKMLSEKDDYYISEDDINTPLKPKKTESADNIIRITCGRCSYIFDKTNRCPECGQLIKYEE